MTVYIPLASALVALVMIPGSLQAVRSKKQIEKTVRIAPVRMTSQPRWILAYVRRHSKAKKSARNKDDSNFYLTDFV